MPSGLLPGRVLNCRSLLTVKEVLLCGSRTGGGGRTKDWNFFGLRRKSGPGAAGGLYNNMEDVKNVQVGPMPPDSAFVKPLRMTFTQSGIQRNWDFVKLHESVSAILYNKKREVLIFVKQFRPAVYFGSASRPTGVNHVPTNVDWSTIPSKLGITVELCAGIVDEPKLSLKEIMQKEVLEECGYNVPLENFQQIISYRSGVGVSGDKNTLFYAEMTDDMKTSTGGGLPLEGEFIEVVEMTIPELKEFINQDIVPSPGGFLFAMMWFLANKAPKS